jgi:DNA (cytosine-5)-methyltransferase 1
MEVSENICGTIRSQMGGHVPIVMATQQGGAEIAEDLCPTITAAAGMSGNNQPIVCIEGTGSRPSHKGKGYTETEVMFTLNTIERHAVCYQEVIGALCAGDSKLINNQMAGEAKFIVEQVKTERTTVGLHQFGGYRQTDCAETLRANSGDVSKENLVIENRFVVRRLVPLECERLQAFPDGWTEWGFDENGKRIEISDSPRYRALGNSIAVVCLDWIFEKIAALENENVGNE